MPLIEFSQSLAIWSMWFERFKLKPVEPRVISDTLVTGLRMAESGLGIILAPMPLITPALSSGQLTAPLRELFVSNQIDFHLIYRKADEGSEKIRALIQWMKSISKSLEEEASRLGYKNPSNKT